MGRQRHCTALQTSLYGAANIGSFILRRRQRKGKQVRYIPKSRVSEISEKEGQTDEQTNKQTKKFSMTLKWLETPSKH